MTRGLGWWLMCAGFACAALSLALIPTDASQVAGNLVPVGNDSFYHARRILEMVADPGSLHQLDAKVHVPEGSVLIWPWGYDYLMSLMTRAGLALTPADHPFEVLARLPALGFALAVLLVALVCRRLRLSTGTTLVALLGLLLLPLNLRTYSLGSIDHHWAEQLFVFGSLVAGTGWLAEPASRARAIAAGLLLGIAPCIHNGLFILQVPLIGALGLQWLNGVQRPVTTPWFAATLVVSTLLVALPAPGLREWSFEFYTLSWFHVYFAACAGAAACYLARFGFNLRSAVLLATLVTISAAPVAGQILLAERFLSVQVQGAAGISETQSLLGLVAGGIRAVTDLYSPLVLLLPLTAALCGYKAWIERDAARRYFWLASLLGLALMAVMVRMHVFGTFALLLPWLVLIDERTQAATLASGARRGLLIAVGLAACAGVVPEATRTRIAGNDPYYALTHDLYPVLAARCARQPGVALSNTDDGNYIRYHTDCAVIANNFLLTAFHESKVREVARLMGMTPRELPRAAPEVRYLFVHRQALFTLNPAGGMRFLPSGDPSHPDPPLVSALMDTPPEALPAEYRLLHELAFERPTHVPYARLFEVVSPPDPAP